MNVLIIDFRYVANRADLYRIFADKCQLPYRFGDNLDALWDVLMAELPLPLHIQLKYLSRHQSPEQFNPVIELLGEAGQALNGLLAVTIED